MRIDRDPIERHYVSENRLSRHKKCTGNNNNRANNKCKTGDKVMVELPGINPKLSTPRTGPYVVSNVNNNGAITINKDGAATQPMNIRRVTPCFD